MSDQNNAPYTSPRRSRVRIPHLRDMKARGQKWAMLTAYDMYAASVFEAAGIPVLLVGDSAANNVFGHSSLYKDHFTAIYLFCLPCLRWQHALCSLSSLLFPI